MCLKKTLDIIMICAPPKGYSNKTDIQYMYGIKISWRRKGD